MKSVKDLNLFNKKVMVRVDYNLPMDENQNITDDNRIRATLPLINYLIERQAKIILISHMGRPGGKVVSELSLAPAACQLSKLIGRDVDFIEDCVGDNVAKKINIIKQGQVVFLENLRFYNQEKTNDLDFAKELASLCDVYINDAFSVSHRVQASVVALPELVAESAAGFLLEKEIQCYNSCVKNPKKPLVAIIGGAKVSTKLKALQNMLNYVDKLIIGGAMANTFLKSQKVDIAASLVEEALIDTAANIINEAKKRNVNLFLPLDLIMAEKFAKDAPKKSVSIKSQDIPSNWMALDIGSKTQTLFKNQIKDAGTIVWNGPMGVFEMPRFCEGTKVIAKAVANSQAFSIVGGGDTGLAVKVCKVADKVSYISTGGGAFLHLMEGKNLPGVLALNKI